MKWTVSFMCCFHLFTDVSPVVVSHISALSEELRWIWGDDEEMCRLWCATAAHIHHAAVLAFLPASLLKQTIYNINTIILQIYLHSG